MWCKCYDNVAKCLILEHESYESQRIVSVALCELQQLMESYPEIIREKYGTEFQECWEHLAETLETVE